MTKEEFLVKKSDSSTSSNSEQGKKLSKKQAKKMAKENRKNQSKPTDDNEKLVNKISQITLQSNPDESGTVPAEEKDDKLPEMPKVTPRPTVYRRHMSESQVDLNTTSNGEFKLKVNQKTLR